MSHSRFILGVKVCHSVSDGRSLGTMGDHWGQADVFTLANIAERYLNFDCFDLAKTNHDEPFVRNTA